MKKNLFIIFAALCAATTVSCTKEIAQSENNNPAEEGPKAGEFLNPVTLTFTADPSTKVSIGDKGKASWEEGDQIVILSFDSEGTARTSDAVTVDKETGSFTATVESSDTYYAVYPASATVSLAKVSDVDNLTVTIPATQGGTLKESIYYAAKTSAEDKTFAFKAVSGIIKFEAAKDYTVAQIRNVENTAERDALHGVAACTFDNEGNLTVTPKPKFSTTHTINLDGSGTYYAAIVGNATNELVLRFKQAETDYEPGVFINKAVEFTPGHIKNCGNLTNKIKTDLYLSPSGTGDGLSAANPASYSAFINSSCLGTSSTGNMYVEGLGAYSGVWNCWRRDGLTVHLAAGEYASGFNIKGDGSAFKMTVQGVVEGADTTRIKGLCTLSSNNSEGTVNTLKDMVFTSSAGALSITAGEWNFNNCHILKCTSKNAVTITAGKPKFTKCSFQYNTCANGGAMSISNGSSTDENLDVSFTSCVISNNTATSAGGAILIAYADNAASGGFLKFDNCRICTNKANNGKGGFLYDNKTVKSPAVMFNKCFFEGNTSTSNDWLIFQNASTARLGFNCCTVNGGKVNVSNGAVISTRGEAVVANTTFWSTGAKKRGLIALGSATKNGSNIVNSIVNNKSTEVGAFWLYKGFYQNTNWCLYTHYTEGTTDIASSNFVSNNSVDFGLSDSAFQSPGYSSVTVDGVQLKYYTFNYTNTLSGKTFTKPTLAQVRASILQTGESASGKGDGFGKTFLDWLDTIENSFATDIKGTSRPEGGLCPGSVEQAN